MELNEEIHKIKKLIYEMSPNSHGVIEFLNFVEEYPEVLKHLDFTSMKSLKDYIMDATYNEFAELRKEAEGFIERRKKYIQSEIDELERVSQDLSRNENIEVSVSQLMDLFQQSHDIEIPEKVWKNLENTECNKIKKGEIKKVIAIAKKYNKQDPNELKKALLSGNYRRPLILKYGDRYHLVAGNTRLCTAAAMGMRPMVLIADLSNLR